MRLATSLQEHGNLAGSAPGQSVVWGLDPRPPRCMRIPRYIYPQHVQQSDGHKS